MVKEGRRASADPAAPATLADVDDVDISNSDSCRCDSETPVYVIEIK